MDLKMEVTQTLGLSQRMIQSTEILQMSAQELDTYLKELAVENPVVDIEEKYDKTGQSDLTVCKFSSYIFPDLSTEHNILQSVQPESGC